MMKRSVFVIIFILPVLLKGQITIDEGILPKVNDVYNTFIDDMPEVNLGRQGTDQEWDFSTLNSGLIYQTTMLPPDPVLIFNALDYDFFIHSGNKIYRLFKRQGDELYEVAIQRPHPLNSDFIVFAKYESPKLVAYGPLSYRSEKTDRSNIFFYMPGNQIPQLIQKKLPITADSLRLKVSEVRDFRVDASGTLFLPYDRFDVLRQEITSRTTTSLEIYSAGKWSKINDYILDPTGELLGTVTQKSYVFYANEEPLPLASILLNENGSIKNIEVKAPGTIDNYVPANTDEKRLILSPNPTYGDVKLELMNLEPGKYYFEVFNIIGKKLWGDELDINRKLSSTKYNFSFLGKGTYLWAITDAQGVRITTKRLVIVTP
ncbi:T9SS type A sorting domain-containing protein [Portibacter marinus]|uniref:T9SS type A sorting domain-containing protein n=1 Tax=Portibacter marinus TaxID=2898660 RepID=UPI001F47B3C6|nr:T9SS type A sorting domain-containing protein [Portibacter marinus]